MGSSVVITKRAPARVSGQYVTRFNTLSAKLQRIVSRCPVTNAVFEPGRY